MRVVIADDQPEVRRLIVRIIAALQTRIEIVGEAENGAEVVKMAAELRPDIVIMDLQMPHMDGAVATTEILRIEPATWVIGFTSADAKGVDALMKAGAVAVISKDKIPDLATTIRGLIEGD